MRPGAGARESPAWDWVISVGLVSTLAWTTFCLGGYLAETMVVTSLAVFALAVVGALALATGRRSDPVRVNVAAWLPVPFLAYALASTLWMAPAKWLAWREWLLWLQMALTFALALRFGRSRACTRLLVGVFVLLGVAGTVLAAYQRFIDPKWMMLGHKQAWQFLDRSAGMFGIPNSLAALLELMIPACLVLLFSRAVSRRGKVLCGTLASFFLFAMALTGSRGGWIGLGLALLAWPVLGGRNWRRRMGGLAFLAVLLGGSFTAFYFGSDAARRRIDPFLEGKFESSRPIVWRGAIRIWETSPWLGTGAASFNVLYNQYREPGFLNEPDWTHNDYLNTLGDYGVVGFALWAGAGGMILWFGWRAVRRARREATGSGDVTLLWRWKFGLWLGLLAFCLHLFVDFHTKLPALAMASAIVAAMLLRDEPMLQRRCRRTAALRAGSVLFIAGIVLLVGMRSHRLYRAEAWRYEPRREINRYAERGGDLADVVKPALVAFDKATAIDPDNGQAWADLAYATELSWHIRRGDQTLLGARADAMARRSIGICPLIAEFWIRRGVAEAMMGELDSAEGSFRQALDLAPNNPEYWYYYAHYLAGLRREEDAQRALRTCLALDPSNRQALALRDHLTVRDLQN